MGDVVNLENYRPHFVVALLDGNVSVMPAALIERIIAGVTPVESLTDMEIRTILSEWLDLYEEGDER